VEVCLDYGCDWRNLEVEMPRNGEGAPDEFARFRRRKGRLYLFIDVPAAWKKGCYRCPIVDDCGVEVGVVKIIVRENGGDGNESGDPRSPGNRPGRTMHADPSSPQGGFDYIPPNQRNPGEEPGGGG
jgi:hypothetical protein